MYFKEIYQSRNNFSIVDRITAVGGLSHTLTTFINLAAYRNGVASGIFCVNVIFNSRKERLG